MTGWLFALAESGRLPDLLLRLGIRVLLKRRLLRETQAGRQAALEPVPPLLARMRQGPIAVQPEAARQQHYELPPAFFRLILGPRLKYSCCFWPPGVTTLAAAEEAMLELTAARAELADGQSLLDLGCGWGSFSLWAAARWPRSRITAVANSRLQIDYLRRQAARLGLTNLRALAADLNDFAPGQRFDRIVTIEMLEHLRHWPLFLSRAATWLQPGGKVFIHIFSHRTLAYFFETTGTADWLGRYFFTGGLMPSDELLLHCQEDLIVEAHWRLNGRHYQRTAAAWLANLDARRSQVAAVLRQHYGEAAYRRWLQRWRLFLLACQELWGYRRGEEWLVSHYRLRPR